MIEEITQNVLNDFDFTYCIVVNIMTYIAIRIIDELNSKKTVSTWTKRIILLCMILSIGVLYNHLGVDTKSIVNSAILAPVFWSWIMKPICKYFNVDYKDIANF